MAVSIYLASGGGAPSNTPILGTVPHSHSTLSGTVLHLVRTLHLFIVEECLVYAIFLRIQIEH